MKISSFIVASDKAWVEDSPVKKAYKSIYIDSAEKEEQTQFVFIILITLFIIIIVCCIIEVYRTDRAHKRRIERETDESIILSKEQAKQMQEAVVGPKFSYRPVSDLDNEVQKKPAEPLVGILKNGSLSKQHSMPEGEKLTKNTGISGEQNLNWNVCIKNSQIALAESQLIDHEPQWDSLIGSQSSLKATNLDDGDDDSASETDLLVSTDPTSLKNSAPLSSISEVTLDKLPLD